MKEINTIEQWLDNNNELGADIWKQTFRFNDETFSEWVNRVSNGNEDIKKLMLEKKFLFAGRILANRGLNKLGYNITYSNCYVITPPKDSIEEIWEANKKLALTLKSGGGCGIDLSKIAPEGARVRNSARTSTGVISFMKIFSLTTGTIGQNGRRGALMLSLDCSHPDIEKFIEIKSDLNEITKANISIRVDNDFMEAVENDCDYHLYFYRPETNHEFLKTVNARKLFRKIAEMNWDYAEPGTLFWDRIKSWSLLSETSEFRFDGVNPCAEEPLPAGGSCLLGSINLSEFVINPFSDKAEFDYPEFEKCVRIAIRGLNEVLDEGLNLHPLNEQSKSVHDWRQIGLGVMGTADMFIKMKIKYGSLASLHLSDAIGKLLINTSIDESANLAKELGKYPKCVNADIINTEFFKYNVKSNELIEKVLKYGLRNSQLTTIAPTGTISTMLGISGAIEPIYANYYTRKTETLHGKDVFYKVYTPICYKYQKANNTDLDNLPEYFIEAKNIPFKDRIDMQSTWQTHIDAAISSTVNVPNDFTIKQTEELYMYAYKQGLKGVTIFRDGCKRLPILSTEEKKEDIKPEEDDICPQCKSKLQHSEGCTNCPECGWAKCSL